MAMRAPLPTRRDAGVAGALLQTLPVRAIVVGVAIKLFILAVAQAGPIPAFLRVVDTVGGLAIAAGATDCIFRLSVIANRRLLWQLRRKMILSYIFIGFVPTLLIVASLLLSASLQH